MCGSLLFLSDYLSAFQPSLHGSALVATILLASLWRPFHLALGYDFASRFPSSVPESTFWRGLRIGLYALAAAFWMPLNLPILADVLGLSSRAALLPSWFPLEAFDERHFICINFLNFVMTAAMCAALVRNYRILPDAGSRRRMRWAGVGQAVAFVPLALDALAQLLLTALGRADLTNSSFFDWAESISMSLVGVSAMTLAYAIVKHRVLGVRLVIRRGMQYLLANNVLRLTLFSPLIILGAQLLMNPHRGIGDVLLRSSWPFYLLVTASAGLSLRYRNQLRRWVDRKFFRTAYELSLIHI